MKKAPFQIVKKEIDDSHYYWIDGEFVPGVTTILDEAAPVAFGIRNFWISNTAEESSKKSNEAKEFGSLIHDAIERLLNGEELNLTSPEYNFTKVKKHLMSFHNWFHEFNPDIDSIQSEQIVGSKEYKYAGTLDLACTKDGELWIIDFKTSAGIYPNYERQVSAYKHAYEEMFGVKVAHTAILRTGTNHKSKYEFKETDRDFESFLTIYKTYVEENGGKIPEPPEVDAYPDTLKIIEK
jgi:hypothetical protein